MRCSVLTAICLLLMSSHSTLSAQGSVDQPRNVLFIAVDDLRAELGSLGNSAVQTPNIDQLVREGRLFSRHYVQVPTCGASRFALITGRYPETVKAYTNNAFELLSDESLSSATMVPLPRLFQSAGYQTVCIGKISHSPDGLVNERDEVPDSWSEVFSPAGPWGKWGSGWNAFFGYADGSTREVGVTSVMEAADVSDEGYPDGLIAEAAIQKLQSLKDQPFFLAVGFFKPHLPFNAPQKYWDLYQPDEIPEAVNRLPAAGVNPTISLHRSREMLGRYTGFENRGQVSAEEARRLKHAYYACVSYTDAQVGRVLDELKRLNLDESTIVVLWGDHGWHLGENGVWGKHTLHEAALRSPLVIRTPDMKLAGAVTNGIVETVDIYPTLAELCDLALPENLSGRSLVGQLEEPERTLKDATYGFWREGRAHTIRTDRYRLIRWSQAKDFSQLAQMELYDHQHDPHETVNIADQHPEIVEQLGRKLVAFYGRIQKLSHD